MAGNEESTRRRLTRAEAKARTREELLDAAAGVFARKGYAGASVEEIAESAGYSTGALYSNFEGKEQLFLELMSARRARGIARRAAEVDEMLNDPADDQDLLALLVQRLERAAGRSVEGAALQAEFWLFAVRNPEAMQLLAEQTERVVQVLAPLVADVITRHGAGSGIAPEAVTRIMLALFQGLVRQRRIDPASVPADLVAAALQWLLAGLPQDQADPE